MDSPENPGGRRIHSRLLMLRWLFFWILLYFAGLLAYNASYDFTRRALIQNTQVRPAALLLDATLPGGEVSWSGETISYGPFALDVRRGCDGLEAWLLLASALLAYPMGWRRRIRSIAYGTILVYALNLLRIVTIFHVSLRRPDLFDIMHGVIWQGIMVLSVLCFVVVWLDPMAGREKKRE